MRLTMALLAAPLLCAQPFQPEIPRTWDDAALEAAQMPLAQPRYSPRQVPAEWYYSVPARTIYKTYPIYHPDHEPAGYIDWLRQQEPEIVFDVTKLVTKQDWIRAGAAVFGYSEPQKFESFFAQVLRNREWFAKSGVTLAKGDVYAFARWVVRKKGQIEVVTGGCASCHTRVMPDGSVINGAPGNGVSGRIDAAFASLRPQTPPQPEKIRAQFRARIFGAPWLGDRDPAVLVTKLTEAERNERSLSEPPGVFVRHGTSPLAPVKIPDLIGIADRRYLDHTGLLRHRSIGDLMRYGSMNLDMDFFASYDGWRPSGNPPDPATRFRYSDEQLYAMALYIYSLEPPPNPNRPSAESRRGEKVFTREGCGACHTAPLYTNNKLTPVQGFVMPEEHKSKYDVLQVVVGTDPMLALETRRGTGYYKVPSLRGVWYRGPFEHSGSVMTLEDWFDSSRLRPDYTPTGYRGHTKTRAIRGHEFGLTLSERDKAALIAFLRTL